MDQKIKSNTYFQVRFNIQKILNLYFAIFTLTIIFISIEQKRNIDILEARTSEQNVLIQNLNDKLNDLENEKSNLEDQLNELESRIDDLEYH